MKKFFKMTFASMVGTLCAVSFLFFVLVTSLAALSVSSDSKWESDLGQVKDNSVLKIVFNGPLKDHLRKKDIISSIMNYDEPPATGLYEISRVLEEAAQDDKIKGLFLHFKNFSSGFANAEALRREIVEFKN